MELVAMDMKERGMYIARQLSFHEVSFKVEDVPIEDDFAQVYDDATRLVRIIDDSCLFYIYILSIVWGKDLIITRDMF